MLEAPLPTALATVREWYPWSGLRAPGQAHHDWYTPFPGSLGRPGRMTSADKGEQRMKQTTTVLLAGLDRETAGAVGAAAEELS